MSYAGRRFYLPLPPATKTLFLINVAVFVANLLLVGYAWQKGLIPLSREAIEQAIEINGVQTDFNRRAFLWGRRAAHDRSLGGPPPAARCVAATRCPSVDAACGRSGQAASSRAGKGREGWGHDDGDRPSGPTRVRPRPAGRPDRRRPASSTPAGSPERSSATRSAPIYC